MKKIYLFFISILSMFFIFSFSACGKNNCTHRSKENWEEIYCIAYHYYSPHNQLEYWKVVTEEEYKENLEEYIYEGRLSINGKAKQLFVRFEGDTVYLKCITWGGNELYEEYKRYDIYNIDYMYY